MIIGEIAIGGWSRRLVIHTAFNILAQIIPSFCPNNLSFHKAMP